MKRFLIVVCLASAIPASRAAAGSFPWWFHTRPRPVLLDDQQTTPADARNRAPNHETAAWQNWGRPGSVDDRRLRQAQPSKPWLTQFLAAGWRTGARPSK